MPHFEMQWASSTTSKPMVGCKGTGGGSLSLSCGGVGFATRSPGLQLVVVVVELGSESWRCSVAASSSSESLSFNRSISTAFLPVVTSPRALHAALSSATFNRARFEGTFNRAGCEGNPTLCDSDSRSATATDSFASSMARGSWFVTNISDTVPHIDSGATYNSSSLPSETSARMRARSCVLREEFKASAARPLARALATWSCISEIKGEMTTVVGPTVVGRGSSVSVCLARACLHSWDEWCW